MDAARPISGVVNQVKCMSFYNLELIYEQAAESLLADLEDGEYVDLVNENYVDDFWFAGFCLSTSF